MPSEVGACNSKLQFPRLLKKSKNSEFNISLKENLHFAISGERVGFVIARTKNFSVHCFETKKLPRFEICELAPRYAILKIYI